MLECNSPWLVNLVSTARDDKNIYMLLEAVMGGELFAYLQVCEGVIFELRHRFERGGRGAVCIPAGV